MNAQEVGDEVAEAQYAEHSHTPEHHAEPPPAIPERGAAHRAGRAAKRSVWAAGILAGVLAGIALAATLGYAVTFRGRIPLGVHALGVDLGGLRPAEAQAALAARAGALARTQPALRVDGREVTLPPGAFGQPDALAARLTLAAAQVGRAAPLGSLGVALRATGRSGTTIDAPVVDTAALRAAVAALAAGVDQPAVEPQIVVDRGAPQAPLRVQPGQAGRRLNVDQTAADLAAAFVAGVTAPPATPAPPAQVVDATFVDIPPTMDDARVEAAKEQAEARLARPVAVGAGGKTFSLPPAAQLVERVDVAGGAAGASGPDLRLTVDDVAFGDFAAQVVNASARPAQDAHLALRGDQVVVVPSSDGEAVDAAGLREALVAGWLAGAARIDAPSQTVPPQVSTEALQPLAAEANRLIAEPLVVTSGEQQWTLGRGDLAKLLALPAGAAPVVMLRLDDDRLAAALQAMAAASERPATNAHLEVQDGQVVAVPGENGEAMDVPATAVAVQSALHTGGSERTVAAAMKPVAADLTVAQVEAARAQATRIIGAPLAVRYGAKTWTLSREDLAGMLMFGDSPGGLMPYLSRTKLLAWAQPIADEVNPQLEQDYAAVRQAWETRRQQRAAQESAAALGAAGPDATPAPQPAADKKMDAPDEPAPQRQWVDVAATAASIWGQATQDPRVTAVRLTTDDPAGAASAAGPQAAAAAAAAARGKWIDVNLTTQTLVAYEGDWPVLTTLVSTGLSNHPTPPGTYKIFSKLLADDMKGGSYATGDYYFLPKVPYVMYFLEGGYALHGTYWHHNFGHPMSHGCVNLPTDQSKLLFDWAPMGTSVVVHV